MVGIRAAEHGRRFSLLSVLLFSSVAVSCLLPAASLLPVNTMKAVVKVVLGLSWMTEFLSSQEVRSQQYHQPFRHFLGLQPDRVRPERIQPQRVQPQRVKPSRLHIQEIKPQRLKYLDPLAERLLLQERQKQVVGTAGVIRQLRDEDDQSVEEYGFSVLPLSLDEEVAWLRGGRLSDWGSWLRGGGESRDGIWIQGGRVKRLGEFGQEEGQEPEAGVEL